MEENTQHGYFESKEKRDFIKNLLYDDLDKYHNSFKYKFNQFFRKYDTVIYLHIGFWSLVLYAIIFH